MDPDSHPIRQPPEDVDEPFLAKDDLPGSIYQPQSFAPASVPESTRTTPYPLLQVLDCVQATGGNLNNKLQDTCSTDFELYAQVVYQVEKILSSVG